MHTSILALLGTVAVFSGCNLSSEVGSNEDDSGGSGGSGTNSGGEFATGGETSASGGRSSGGAGPTSTTTTTTSTSTGGGPEIQNAHVYVSATTSLGWIGEQTVIAIYANADPVNTSLGQPTPCAASQVPTQPSQPPSYLDLSGARVRITAQGYGAVDAVWSDSNKTLYASYQEALPAGTPLALEFDATSTLSPGQSLALRAQNMTLQSPALEQVLIYPSGADWVFDWTSEPMDYAFSSFTVPANLASPPPASMLVARCVGDGSTSAVTLSSSVMGALVTDMQSQPQGAQIWLSLSLLETGAAEEPWAGNFLTVTEGVHMSRPVVVQP